MSNLPVLGAAMRLDYVEQHRDWLLEKPRDLELQDFVTADTLEGDWAPLVKRAANLLDGHSGRLGIHGPYKGFSIASHDPDVRAIVAKRLEQSLDVAAALGANQIVIHSPYTTWVHHNLHTPPSRRTDVIDYAHQTLEGALRRAEDEGRVFVLENIEDKDPADRRGLVETFNSPALALSIDTGHAAYAFGSTGAPPIDHFVRDAAEKLQHVHLQDADGYADRHWPIGHGSINWRAIFSALAEVNSNPRLIIEIRDKTQIPASAAYLAALGLAQ